MSNKNTFEFTHIYPGFERQKFWDMLVDDVWFCKSEITPGEILIEKPGEGFSQSPGGVRRLKIGNTELIEELSSNAPEYFRYDIQNGVLPINNYYGEYFLEEKDRSLVYRYRGTFDKKLFGTNWFYKWFLAFQGKKMIAIWEKGYYEYHGIEEKK